MSGPVLRTERLELLPFGAEDAESLHALFTDPGVRRWLLDDQLVALAWVEEEIAQSEARFAAGSCGLWALREAGSGEVAGIGRSPDPTAVVGFTGLRYFWDPPELELVYGLHPSWWRQGLATEAARAVTAYAFDTLRLSEVRAATDVPNTDSIAVLRRLGFEEWSRTDEGPAGTLRFRLSSARWRDGRR